MKTDLVPLGESLFFLKGQTLNVLLSSAFETVLRFVKAAKKQFNKTRKGPILFFTAL